MIRYCFIVAVIMIYPYLTNASFYISWGNREDLERELKKDAPLLGSRLIGRTIAKQFYGNRIDIVCDVLDNDQKQLLCDEMMKEMIFHETVTRARSFFDADSRPPVPHLADSSDPYKCVRIPIANFHFSKRMFWCRARKFHEDIGPRSGIGEEAGFFLGGRPFLKDHIFAFVLSKKNRNRVVPRALLYEVKLLRNKGPTHERSCSGCSKNERSSPSIESSTRPSSSHDSSEDSSSDSSSDSSKNSSHDSSDSD